MQKHSQQQLFTVKLELPGDKERTVKVKAGSPKVAEQRALKRVDNAVGVKEVTLG